MFHKEQRKGENGGLGPPTDSRSSLAAAESTRPKVEFLVVDEGERRYKTVNFGIGDKIIITTKD